MFYKSNVSLLSETTVSCCKEKNTNTFLTYEQSRTQQNSHQGAGAQAHRHRNGLSGAGRQRALGATRTHSDVEGAGAALGRVTAVFNHHGQKVDVLQSLLEA